MTEAEGRAENQDVGVDQGLAAWLQDPWGTLEAMRAEGPVARNEIGAMVVGHQLARSVLTDASFAEAFLDSLHLVGITDGAFYDWMAGSPLNADGDEHRRWRSFMSRTFTPRSVERLEPFLRSTADELCRGFHIDGHVDLVAEFAHHLPLAALCELIGVPAEDRATFTEWADTMGQGFNPMEAAGNIESVDAAVTSLLEYGESLIRQRRADPRDDLVSRIATLGAEAGFPDAQLRGSVAGLVFAGHETTKNQLGWMLRTLMAHPDVWNRVGLAPSQAPTVVEECLRYRSAITGMLRHALDDVTVDGCPFPKGERVNVSIWGANHDPVIAGDGRFDVEPDGSSPHLAFGHGPHYCLGASLARLELTLALQSLSAGFDCPVLVQEPDYRPPLGITGPHELVVRLTPR